MTFEEAKDHVAKKHGYNSWAQVLFYAIDAMAETTKPPYAEQALQDEAAEFYATAKAAQAWEEGYNAREKDIGNMNGIKPTNPYLPKQEKP